MKFDIQYCPPIPYGNGEVYCYPEVWLSTGDKVALVIAISLLVAISITEIQSKLNNKKGRKK